MGAKQELKRTAYAGLMLVTLATLMYEILLTRIFSVTIWYHFAFFAISVAMFGATVGSLLVYLLPGYFIRERAHRQQALSALLFAVTIVFSFLIFPLIPLQMNLSALSLASLLPAYVIISLPFIMSGICICIALTRFPEQVGKLYAADLVGAGFGCILVILVLEITDAPTAIFVVAAVSAAGSAMFSWDRGERRLVGAAVSLAGLLLVFSAVNTVLVENNVHLLRLKWVKGLTAEPLLYEKWNSYSQITVRGNPDVPGPVSGWGISQTWPADRKIRQLKMSIDSTAVTVMAAFDGDLSAHDYLKYDVVNLVHYLRPNADALVIGTGGGRDVLSALVFKQRSVLGVEINRDIIRTVNGRFGDFSGHLDRRPGVEFVNDEARSFVARSGRRFDIIQVSLIDTWAATAAGAYVFTENSLYTVEAWDILLGHLKENGVLTFSRWYDSDNPGEIYRLTNLARQALLRLGVDRPQDHIILVRSPRPKVFYQPDGVGTILVGRHPFTPADVETVRAVCEKMRFEFILAPGIATEANLGKIATGQGLEQFTREYPLNIEPPTDNDPFFFYMVRLGNLFNPGGFKNQPWLLSHNEIAVTVLGVLFITVVILTGLCVVVPLLLTSRRGVTRGAVPLLIYFAGLGLGFMLIEIAQLQRLIVFLGHPTYSLSVVLFSLLISSGIGSLTTGDLAAPAGRKAAILRLGLLLAAVTVIGFATPWAGATFQSLGNPARIAISVAMLSSIGFFMGMAFPLGINLAAKISPEITPWLWGVNGATSVLASVLAIVISLNAGIAASYWTGLACYLAAFVAFVRSSRR